MKARTCTAAVLGALALCCVCSPGALGARATPAAGPALSPPAYAVSTLCARPSSGHAGCLGLRLVARAPLSVPHARALGAPARGALGSPAAEFKEPLAGSLAPGDLLSAYNLPGAPAGTGQTIAIVDAYDDATIEADLEHYDQQFGLSACTEQNGCFRKVNQEGHAAPLPASAGIIERGWAQEIATDVELAHGLCQSCRILLVEAKSNYDSDLFAAEATAARLGASEISNSWGGEEPPADSPAFNQPGVVVTAASGDNGYLNWLEEPPAPYPDYPASSPHVVAVGGTRLALTHPAQSWAGETVWNDGGEQEGFTEGAGASGGGCSTLFAAPPWQQSASDWAAVGCGAKRAIADLAADADPYTGVAIYDSTKNPEGNKGWGVIGGTSVASPIIAAVFALAGGAHGVAYPAQTVYENAQQAPGVLHDVVSGSNGECSKPFNEKTGTSGCSSLQEAESCSGALICLAAPGYDGPSGVGTPNGLAAFRPSPGSQGGQGANPANGGQPAGGKGGVGGSAGGQAGGEGEAIAPGASAAAPGPGVSTLSLAAPLGRLTPVLSGLKLTFAAARALHRAHPHVSQVGFTFALSRATSVRATLARQFGSGARRSWKTTARSSMAFATGGRKARRLGGSRVLAPGRYRLTLSPAAGRAETIVFRIR